LETNLKETQEQVSGLNLVAILYSFKSENYNASGALFIGNMADHMEEKGSLTSGA